MVRNLNFFSKTHKTAT